MTFESWKELRCLFSTIECYLPPKTEFDFVLKDGTKLRGYLYMMEMAEDENGEEESAATIYYMVDDKEILDVFRFSRFASVKCGELEWKAD